MARPWLSVVMPTFNGAAYLKTALDSVVAQRDRDLEVIAVDDGSTDDTLDILRRYSNRLAITAIERPYTGNWAANTNLGMSMARGDYVCWLHQDDAWRADRLDYLKQWLTTWPDAQLLIHPSRLMNAAGRIICSWRCPFPSGQMTLQPDKFVRHLLVQNFIAASAAVFRAEAVCRLGGLDQELWYCADWDFWLKLASLGQTVHGGVPLASFRVHACSQTLSCPDRLDDVRRQYATVLDRHLPRLDGRLPNADRIARIARFSAECNLGMMRFLSGNRVGWFGLASQFLRLGPQGWAVFFHDSRIVERVGSRLLARLAMRPHTSLSELPRNAAAF